jgi:hypothetical protein
MRACGGVAAATATGKAFESDAFWTLPLPPATDFASLKPKLLVLPFCSLIPTELAYGLSKSNCKYLLRMEKKDPKSRLEALALTRQSAVSWIEQSLNQGNTLARALALAAELEWGGRRYSPRTLEDWFYEWRLRGFTALEGQSRKDKGALKALSAQDAEAIVKLRLQHPAVLITTLVHQLEQSGVLVNVGILPMFVYRKFGGAREVSLQSRTKSFRNKAVMCAG